MPHRDLIVDGAKWPSVTEITGLAPQGWRWEWFEREVKKHGWRGWQKCIAHTNRGARIGTGTHGLIEARFNGEVYAVKEKNASRRALIQRLADTVWNNFIVPSRIKPVKLESHVICKWYRYGGTFDGLFTFGDSPFLWLLDWKTSNKIDPWYALQLAAYAHAWNCTHPEQQVNAGGIIRVDKKAKKPYVEVGEFQQLDKYFPIFVGLRMAWEYEYRFVNPEEERTYGKPSPKPSLDVFTEWMVRYPHPAQG